MGLGDKLEHMGEEIKGKVKEAVGEGTDNQDLAAEGQADQAQANVKQAGDKVGDAVRDVTR